jgi:16S rRNA (guanine527-N7)-methyltransferase
VKQSLGALVDRYQLDPGAMAQLEALLAILGDDPLAPTTMRDPARALNDHLADSLVALELNAVRVAGSIADLGSGAGLPGLPLAIARPDAALSLVESNRRKGEFIARAAAAARVMNVEVVNARAEAWPDGRDRFDLVTARALAPLPVVAEYAAPLLRIGGSLVAWRGRRDLADEAAGRTAAAELGLEMGEPQRVDPYPGAVHRHLQAMVKVAATPARFPRRPGVARKRPLGRSAR